MGETSTRYCQASMAGEAMMPKATVNLISSGTRANMSKTGASESDIDRIFGWNESWYRKKMQLHYAGREDRVKRAKYTAYV